MCVTSVLAMYLLAPDSTSFRVSAADSDVFPIGSSGKEVSMEESCSQSSRCTASNMFCNMTTLKCQCYITEPFNDGSRCLPGVGVNESCRVEEQCQPHLSHTTCSQGRCVCLPKYYIHTYIDGVTSCIAIGRSHTVPVDPVMIAVLASLVLMFIIICVVLRLFSKARFRQNQTILNTANSRLANASFFKAPVIKPAIKQLRGVPRADSLTHSVESLKHADPQMVEIAIQQESRRTSQAGPRPGTVQEQQSARPAGRKESTQMLVQVDTHV